MTDNAVLALCAFVVREGWEQREDEGDYPRGLAQKALAEADALRAEIAALKAEVETTKAWQGAAVLRNYDAVHILIEEIGAPGPENIDETARRAVAVIRAHKRALAAGPAALRIDARDGIPWGPYKQLPVEEAVATVERAQEAAMKEGKP